MRVITLILISTFPLNMELFNEFIYVLVSSCCLCMLWYLSTALVSIKDAKFDKRLKKLLYCNPLRTDMSTNKELQWLNALKMTKNDDQDQQKAENEEKTRSILPLWSYLLPLSIVSGWNSLLTALFYHDIRRQLSISISASLDQRLYTNIYTHFKTT